MNTMRVCRTLTFLLPLVLAGASSAEDPAEAEADRIRLARPMKAGTKYRLTAEGSFVENAVKTKTGKAPKRKQIEIRVELEAVVEVLEADRKGIATRRALSIERCTQTEDGITRSGRQITRLRY